MPKKTDRCSGSAYKKAGRNATTGRFTTVTSAKRSPRASTVEHIPATDDRKNTETVIRSIVNDFRETFDKLGKK